MREQRRRWRAETDTRRRLRDGQRGSAFFVRASMLANLPCSLGVESHLGGWTLSRATSGLHVPGFECGHLPSSLERQHDAQSERIRSRLEADLFQSAD